MSTSARSVGWPAWMVAQTLIRLPNFWHPIHSGFLKTLLLKDNCALVMSLSHKLQFTSGLPE